MIIAPRFLWLVVLACFACGCTCMKTARWPDAPIEPGAPDPGLPVVAVGDHVTVNRLDGTRVTGRLLAITDESVTVEVDRGIGINADLGEQSIPRVEISAVSEEKTSLGRTLLMFVGILGGIVAMAAADYSSGG